MNLSHYRTNIQGSADRLASAAMASYERAEAGAEVIALKKRIAELEATVAAASQSFMQALALTSGFAPAPNSRPGHSACVVVMPLRLGMRCCTCAILRSDSVKSSGTTPPRFSGNAVTA